jgi:hypothetical protein
MKTEGGRAWYQAINYDTLTCPASVFFRAPIDTIDTITRGA